MIHSDESRVGAYTIHPLVFKSQLLEESLGRAIPMRHPHRQPHVFFGFCQTGSSTFARHEPEQTVDILKFWGYLEILENLANQPIAGRQ